MKRYSSKEKAILMASLSLAVFLGFGIPSQAMHIMEGYLPPVFCIAWMVVSIPFLALGVMSIKKIVDNDRKTILLLAMAGAFVFVISSLKIPSVTGSCSHMTGTGLAAILFGVPATSILGLIVLLFQAILLAHGGLTSLGANVFSMAIAGPILSYVLFKALDKTNVNRKVSVFLAAFLGDLFTYCVTATQLALAYPSPEGGFGASLVEFLGVFAPTQLPLSILEGLITMMVVVGLESYAKPELRCIGFLKEA